MSRNVRIRATISTIAGAALTGALIFLPAGTFDYWQGWALVGVIAAWSVASMLLLGRDRGLIERRSKIAESEPSQKVIVLLLYLDMFALVIVSVLDHRFHWSPVTPVLAVVGDAIVACGLCLYLVVFRENTFAGSTIEVVPGQQVISTGPYGAIRHPLYVALLVTCFGSVLALGSSWGLVLLVPLIPLIAWRLLDEEAYLSKNLPGYADYQRKVRWRLIPGLF